MIYVSRRLLITCLLLVSACVVCRYLGITQRCRHAGNLAGIRRVDRRCAAQYDDGSHRMAFTTRADGAVDWRHLASAARFFQSLMRNPLGSPDVMGFNTGAWSGVLVAMVLFGQDLTAIALAAMAGGIVTSLLVWLLARRNGIDTFG